MGSCVSSHKSLNSSTKMGLPVDSKAQNMLVSSPTNEKQVNGDSPIQEFSSGSLKSSLRFDFSATDPNKGTKEEAFFDSQAWLESDCEDDFLSVNGDGSTPSCNSSPNHQRRTSRAHRTSEFSFTDRLLPLPKPESSQIDKKVSLSELLKETQQEEEQVTNCNQNAIKKNPGLNRADTRTSQKASDKTSCLSQANSINGDQTSNIGPKQAKKKTLEPTQCCLPNFVHSLSFMERKKRLSPNPI